MLSVDTIEQNTKLRKIPKLQAGFTVAVHEKIKEGDKERIQVFEGIVIATKGGGPRRMITVRRIASGVGVERNFLVHSPTIDKIEIKKKAKVRRSKLYYLRERFGRSARVAEDREGMAKLQEEVEKLAEEVRLKEEAKKKAKAEAKAKEEADKAEVEEKKEEPKAEETKEEKKEEKTEAPKAEETKEEETSSDDKSAEKEKPKADNLDKKE
ncbi:50S ribosomal protein L19 [Patescibacteria group bacterium]